MPTVPVVTIENQKAGTVELDPAVFQAPIKPHLFHAEVRRQLAARRAGTHSTKNRHMVSGGGVKPWRQKGTGRARQGSIRSPQWKGGGVVFGPVPRSYDHKLPKQVRRAALRGALSHRLREGGVVVVDDLDLDGFSTRRMQGILTQLGLGESKVLIVLGEPRLRVERSARNLPGTTVLRAEGLNVYDVLRHEKLLLTKPALSLLSERLGTPAEVPA
jgi:large subunit ribosomal protein L4